MDIQLREGSLVWWAFERLIKSTERCLRKMVDQGKLSYDNLCAVVNEIEVIMNSKPLTYVPEC